MNEEQKYTSFQRYILRTPLLPINYIRRLVKDGVIIKDALLDACADEAVMEALFLASPSFYREVQKWREGKLPNSKEEDKVMQGLYRYLARMCTRCTPFGMFAGITAGTVADKTDIKMSPKETNITNVRLDMNYVCALAKDIAEIPEIKEQILFYPNNSMYRIGEKMRYVEYSFNNARRSHHISAVDASDYLMRIINEAKQGRRLIQLAQLIVDDEITIDDAKAFIDEVVASQLLTSELEPTVIGADPLEQMISVLDKYSENAVATDIKNKLIGINELIKQPKRYNDVKQLLSAFTTAYDEKFLFQADMLLKPAVNTVSQDIPEDVFKAVALLNRVTPYFENENLRRFKEAFYNRYEDEEIPLAQALDNETGIGYLQNTYSGITPLVDNILFPPAQQNYKNSSASPFHLMMQQKLADTLKQGERQVTLDESDFDSFEMKWDDMQETISAFIEMIDDKRFVMKTAGGASAAYLIGRFCHLDKDILGLTQDIIEKDEANKDCVYAEIVHLPESRVGNILHRPTIRQYEIPYLAQSSLPLENQIDLDDLMISVRYDKIFLRSKRHNKLVIPRLTTAHNYSVNALPVYQFLCDMQHYEKRGGFNFSWGSIENSMPYLPRVVYGDAVLSLEKWNFFKKDIDSLNKTKDLEERIDRFMEMAKNKNISNEVLLEDGDNELYFDLTNRFCVKTLLDYIKKRLSFTLIEFPFADENSPVKSAEGCYANEMIFAYYKQKQS